MSGNEFHCIGKVAGLTATMHFVSMDTQLVNALPLQDRHMFRKMTM